jgi:(p)ppGpp synthase/HD superfamily hydrolase
MIFRAIKLATDAHEGQYRKGTSIPYITHPMNVMKTLSEIGCDEEVVVAGILHDVLEDTPVRPDVIERKFGKRVVNMVVAASEPEELRDKKGVEGWQKRKQHTIDHILNTPSVDKLLVSCADKLDNARAIQYDYERIGDKLWTRFNAGKEKVKWYYQSLAQAFLKRASDTGSPLSDLAKELDKTVKAVFG